MKRLIMTTLLFVIVFMSVPSVFGSRSTRGSAKSPDPVTAVPAVKNPSADISIPPLAKL